jgi:hypothetical protein
MGPYMTRERRKIEMNPQGRAVFIDKPPQTHARVRYHDAFVELDEFKNPRHEIRLQKSHPTERVVLVGNDNGRRSHCVMIASKRRDDCRCVGCGMIKNF